MMTHQAAPSAGPNHLSDATLAEVGTLVWRLRRRLEGHDSGDGLAQRQVEELWEVLGGAGLEIRDHTDQVLPEGGSYSLRVLALEPTIGLERERVLVTVRPSVLFQGRLLQVGQVIVGVPVLSEDGGATATKESRA